MDNLLPFLGILGVIFAVIFANRENKKDFNLPEKKKQKNDLEDDMQEAENDLEDDLDEHKEEAIGSADDPPSNHDVESLVDRLRSRYGKRGVEPDDDGGK